MGYISLGSFRLFRAAKHGESPWKQVNRHESSNSMGHGFAMSICNPFNPNTFR